MVDPPEHNVSLMRGSRRPHHSNYIRMHRKKGGFSQGELSALLGRRPSKWQISRHERGVVPSFRTALVYASFFQVPVEALFPGLKTTVTEGVEKGLAMHRAKLCSQNELKPSRRTAQQLAWLTQRTS